MNLLQGVDGEMQLSKSRRRRRLLQDGKHSPGTQFDLGLLQQTSDATEPCTESITCAPEWEETARGVVSIYAINTRIRALGLCTGDHLGMQVLLHVMLHASCTVQCSWALTSAAIPTSLQPQAPMLNGHHDSDTKPWEKLLLTGGCTLLQAAL